MSVIEIPVRPVRVPARLRRSGEIIYSKSTEQIVHSGDRRLLADIAVTVAVIKEPPARILKFPRLQPPELQSSLAGVELPREESLERSPDPARGIQEKTIFSIGPDNHIRAHATAARPNGIAETEQFASLEKLGRLAAAWPAARLVEIWNNLPGQKPVKKFPNPKQRWTAFGLLFRI